MLGGDTMAYVKTKEGANATTNQKEFFLDAYSDLATIPTTAFQFGDYAYILSGDNKGEIYMANSLKAWILQ